MFRVAVCSSLRSCQTSVCMFLQAPLILQLMHMEVNKLLLHLADEAFEEKGEGLTAA